MNIMTEVQKISNDDVAEVQVQVQVDDDYVSVV